jgi:hypothetical protein
MECWNAAFPVFHYSIILKFLPFGSGLARLGIRNNHLFLKRESIAGLKLNSFFQSHPQDSVYQFPEAHILRAMWVYLF